MSQETGVERLDYSKPPPGYTLQEDEDCDGVNPNAAGDGGCLPTKYWSTWYWVLKEEDDAGSTMKTEAAVLAAAWAHYKTHNDPPGCSIGLVMKGQGATTRGEFVVDWGTSQVAAVPAYKGKAQRAGAYQEARAAAWAWHDRRHALAGLLGRSLSVVTGPTTSAVVDVWPRCLAWTDDQAAEVERFVWALGDTAFGRGCPPEWPAVLPRPYDPDEDPVVGALIEAHARESGGRHAAP